MRLTLKKNKQDEKAGYIYLNPEHNLVSHLGLHDYKNKRKHSAEGITNDSCD